jgi:cytochrome P450
LPQGFIANPGAQHLRRIDPAGNPDPEKSDEPDKIRLARPCEYVVFGRGMHPCVGHAPARMEVGVVLSAMLAHETFPASQVSESPEWDDSLLARRQSKLPIKSS